MANFQPLHPHLAASPEDLELTNAQALKVKENTGLENNHIETAPRERTVEP